MAKILGGKQISQLSLFDYINGITIGSIGAELATSEWTDTLDPLIAIVLYTIAAFLINFISDHCIILRRFLEGRSVILVKGGTFNRSAFHRAKLNLNEFMVQCRASGYYNMQDIDTAILERTAVHPAQSHCPSADTAGCWAFPQTGSDHGSCHFRWKDLSRKLKSMRFGRNLAAKEADGTALKSFRSIFGSLRL